MNNILLTISLGPMVPSYNQPALQAEILPFSEKATESQARHNQSMQEWENRRRAKQAILPTDGT